MKLLTLTIVTLLFILARSSDLAISNAIAPLPARSIIRAIVYGLVALLALIVLLVVLFGLH